MSDQLEKDFRILGKKHSARVLDKLSTKEIMSSSEIVVESGIQPVQVYRVLSELKKAKFIEREETSGNIKEPHVFWKLTSRGKAVKKLIDDYKEKAISFKD